MNVDFQALISAQHHFGSVAAAKHLGFRLLYMRIRENRLDDLAETGEAAKEVVDQIVDGDEVISPRLLFCKSFATGGIRAKARPGCSRGGRGDYSAGNLVVQIFCNRH